MPALQSCSASGSLRRECVRDHLADTFSAERTGRIWNALRAAGLTAEFIEPAPAPREVIEYVHTPLYLDAVRDYSDGTRARADGSHLLGPTVPVA